MPSKYTPYINFLKSLNNGYEFPSTQQPAFGDMKHGLEKNGYLFCGMQSIVFLLDFTQRKYLAMSPSIEQVLGFSPRYVVSGGLDFVINQYHPQDGKIYFNEIFFRNLDYLKRLPVEEHPGICFTYNYRFKNNSGSYQTILQKYIIVQSAPDKTPVLMLATLTDITHFKTDTSIVHTIERINGKGSTLLYKHTYFTENLLPLSARETEVLKWITEGLSSKQIAEKLYLSEFTIHNHRKNMLKKTGSRNVAELVHYANERGLF